MSYDDGGRAWKGRDVHQLGRGDNHRNAKLTEVEVRKIKQALAQPYDHRPTSRTLAAAYGVSIGTIKDIGARRRWSHVKLEEDA